MSKKIKIESDLKQGTEITVSDYSKMANDGEAIVEVHYHYSPIKQYEICYYPEHWQNAKDALENRLMNFIAKVVYHMPAETETN